MVKIASSERFNASWIRLRGVVWLSSSYIGMDGEWFIVELCQEQCRLRSHTSGMISINTTICSYLSLLIGYGDRRGSRLPPRERHSPF